MKVLFLIHRFFPCGDAATKCVAGLLAPLQAQGIAADVLCVTPYPSAPVSDIGGGRGQVFRSWAPGCADREEFRLLLKSSPAAAAACIVQKLWFRAMRRLIAAFRQSGMDWGLYHAFRTRLKKILRTRRYDAVIATVCCIESAWAVYMLCPEAPWYLYQLDPYSENEEMAPASRAARRRIEQRLYQKAAAVFTTGPVYRQKQAAGFPFLEKCSVLEFPLIQPQPAQSGPGHPEGNIVCAFTGTLYPGIRPPEEFVRLVSRLKMPKAVFCCAGSRQHLITQAPDYPAAAPYLRCLGRVPTETADALVDAADFLINIDNRASNQVPSKIFEYISTGKPVINLHSGDTCPSGAYLRRYPLALDIDCTRDAAENALLLERFLTDSLGQRVPPAVIRANFAECTPAYVAQKMAAVLLHPKHTAVPAKT